MLNLQALQRALATVENIGKGEMPFEINGLHLTVRTITPEEDIEVQKFSIASRDAAPMDDVKTLVFLENYKRAIISHALVQIGNLNLRNETTVETGETTDEGVPIRIPRHVAVRKIVTDWSKSLTSMVFQRYVELQNRVEQEAEEKIAFDPADLDAEISRVEKRLEYLRTEREKLVHPVPNPSAHLTNVVGAIDRGETPSVPEVTIPVAPKPPQTVQKRPEPPPVAPLPQAALVPDEPAQEPQQPVRSSPIPTRVAPPPRREQGTPSQSRQPEIPPPHMIHDSMGMSDEDIGAETARLLEIRRQTARHRAAMAAAEQAEAPEAIPVTMASRRPPHMDAQEIDGVPIVERREAEVISARGLRRQGVAAPPINQESGEGFTNPRFAGKVPNKRAR